MPLQKKRLRHQTPHIAHPRISRYTSLEHYSPFRLRHRDTSPSARPVYTYPAEDDGEFDERVPSYRDRQDDRNCGRFERASEEIRSGSSATAPAPASHGPSPDSTASSKGFPSTSQLRNFNPQSGTPLASPRSYLEQAMLVLEAEHEKMRGTEKELEEVKREKGPADITASSSTFH